MIAINYLDNKEIRKDIGPLFERAFPEDERPPADIFFSSFKKQNNKVLLGFYKENAFIGFTSLIIYKDIIITINITSCFVMKKWMRNMIIMKKE